ncbi:redoxin family protein [Rhodobacterales bacterium HKCCE2091]|nr:redoxin family protein [Rhodobacterales bacterium HKCCE2091]
MIASGPAANRPPHIAFEDLSLMPHPIRFRRLALYLAAALSANAALAEAVEPPREGDMRAMVLAEAPGPVPATAFTDFDGAEHSLADYAGRYVLLNFWATWCQPCREEMPALDALERELGGEDFAVVTIATGRNPEPAVTRFFEEEALVALPKFIDPTQALAREMGVFGLPVTILIDPEGREVGRMTGGADWTSPEARAFLAAYLGES